jgi:hypothetical protein
MFGFRVMGCAFRPLSFVQLYKLSGPVNKYLGAHAIRRSPESGIFETMMGAHPGRSRPTHALFRVFAVSVESAILVDG